MQFADERQLKKTKNKPVIHFRWLIMRVVTRQVARRVLLSTATPKRLLQRCKI